MRDDFSQSVRRSLGWWPALRFSLGCDSNQLLGTFRNCPTQAKTKLGLSGTLEV